MVEQKQIYIEDFQRLVKSEGLEVHTNEQILKQIAEKGIIEKGSLDSLSSDEKDALDVFGAELLSLRRMVVIDDNLKKSIVYVRESQIDWEDDLEKGELGEILKAKSGIYSQTSLNKKLGRVGQKYGSKKVDPEKKENKTLPNVSSLEKKAANVAKGKPVNERSPKEISEARAIIEKDLPPIHKMTWEEWKPYGVAIQKQSSHSQPASFYERFAKMEHDWAVNKYGKKGDKDQGGAKEETQKDIDKRKEGSFLKKIGDKRIKDLESSIKYYKKNLDKAPHFKETIKRVEKEMADIKSGSNEKLNTWLIQQKNSIMSK